MTALFTTLIFAWALAAGITGCSRAHYRRSADHEAYEIIQKAEQKIFGKTNAFTIDSQYSGRDPSTLHPDEIIGGRTLGARRVINLDQTLDLAVENSREYKAQKEQLYLSALTLTGAAYEFSPQFFASSTATIAGTPAGTQSGDLHSRVGVSQFLSTGGRLSVSLANDLLRYFTGWSSSPGNSSRDSAINLVTADLSQPILRGFGRNDARVENLTQAERNVIYAVRSFSQYQRQFAVDSVSSYFSILALKDSVRNNYTNYLRRVDTTAYLDARAVDRVRKSDVDDARTAELSARIDYINSVASYLSSVASFKLRLGIPQGDEVYLDDADLRSLEKAGLVGCDLDRTDAFKTAIGGHMEILNAIDRFEDTQRKVRIAADQLKPGLLLSGSANLQSDAPYDYARFDINQVRYSAGVTLDLPVDRLRERNTYRASLVSFESQVRSLTLTLDSFKNRIDDGLRTLEQRRLNFLNRQAALEVATRRQELTRELLEAGRATIRDLREAQDQLIGAQNALSLTLVDYLRTRLQLLLDVGILRTEDDGFWLKPGPPKAPGADKGPTTPLHMPEGELFPPNRFLDPAP